MREPTVEELDGVLQSRQDSKPCKDSNCVDCRTLKVLYGSQFATVLIRNILESIRDDISEMLRSGAITDSSVILGRALMEALALGLLAGMQISEARELHKLWEKEEQRG